MKRKVVQRRSSKKASISVKSIKINGVRQRGVYSDSFITSGSLIEDCPFLILTTKSRDLSGYVYEHDDGSVALALGYGSLYNHSFEPNATAENNGKTIEVTAIRDIHPGEQILINYGYKERDYKKFGIKR
jgi:hypothetical protein